MGNEQPWAVRVERPTSASTPTDNGSAPRRPGPPRRQVTMSRPLRRLVQLMVLAAVALAGTAVPWSEVLSETLAEALPDTLTLARESEAFGWNAPADNLDLARDVFDRVNHERQARGLAPLDWHPGLAELAGRWSQRMIEDGYEHSPDGFLGGRGFVGFGENIAMGQRNTGELHVDWMRSDVHRQNVLLPEFTAMGVGIVCRGDGRMWATQVFGLPADAPMLRELTVPPADPIVRRDTGVACATPPESTLRR